MRNNDYTLKLKLLEDIRWSEVPEYLCDEVISLLGIKFRPSNIPEGSTKYCPNCNNTHLLLLQTLNKKICTDCNTEIPWNLDDNQKPLI